jgi:hypothetical protein
MRARSLVVSIHDVSPLTREPVAAILETLAELGVGKCSLLVIPDVHHRGNINTDPSFGPWLRGLATTGHEIVLHGYYHQRERRSVETPATRFFTGIYTAGEGEFFDITYNDARALLTRGRDDLVNAAGAEPAGFIAPAWLLSTGGEEALRRLDFAYTTRLKSVSDFVSERIHDSQSLCWSVRSRWRRVASLGWNQILFDSLRINPLLRISIHPPDIAHPAIWQQIQHLIQRAIEDREPVTYGEFVARARGS